MSLQVLQNFAGTELEQERLAYFATAEGRDDLYRYSGAHDVECHHALDAWVPFYP